MLNWNRAYSLLYGRFRMDRDYGPFVVHDDSEATFFYL